MPLHLKTTKDIPATPERVWAVLSDLDAYAEWNPFIPSAAGKLAEGERLDIRIQPPEGRATRFRPTIQAATPNRELRWLGHLGVRGIFDGEHRFAIEPTATGTRLTHEERFSGVLVPLFAKGLRRRYLPAFEEMNAALAARVAA
jgi:hypothetical protein